MSLLLDALNRASRDKVAGAAAQIPSDESDGGAVVPTASPAAAAAAPPVVLGQTGGNPLSLNASDWPPLEFSLTPPGPAPVVKSPVSVLPSGGKPAVLSLTPKLPETPPATDPVSIRPALFPAPAAPAASAAAAPTATVPFFKEEPAPLPPDGVRAAQNIVRAKAVPAAAGNRRRMVLLAIAVLLGAGMASVWLGLGGEFRALAGFLGFDREMDKTNAVVVTAAPAAPLLAEIQPGVPATQAAIPPETAALATTPLPVTAAPAPRTPTVRARPRDAPALPVMTPELNDSARASVQSSSSGPSILEIAYQDLISGRLPEAGVAYGKALAVNPQERDALLGLAYIAQRQGRKEDALSLYKQVLRQEPGNVTARAGILSLNPSGDLQDFGNQSREVAEQNPDSAAAQSVLGHALVRQNLLADARVAFSRAMQLAPEVPRHAFNLAVAFDRLHNYEEAQRYYERAVSLMKQRGSEGTSGFALADVMTRLEQLRFAASSSELPPN